ncbi:MAG: glutaredoxin domain-containing protein [Methylococcaceae bacterium]
MDINRLWVILFTLVFALPAHAEIYKWIDAEGTSHFTASKPVNSVSIKRLHEIEAQAVAAQSNPADSKAQTPAQQVDLYVTSWCPYCKKAIAYLRSNNIAFQEYDIELDLAAAERKKTLDPNYSGIPLAVINGVVIRGFDEDSYHEAMAKQPN